MKAVSWPWNRNNTISGNLMKATNFQVSKVILFGVNMLSLEIQVLLEYFFRLEKLLVGGWGVLSKAKHIYPFPNLLMFFIIYITRGNYSFMLHD